MPDSVSLQRPTAVVAAVAEHAAERSGFQRFIDRVFDRHTDERAWRRGAQGEEEVARGGVFALNTKHLTGRVWVASRVFMHNGHKTDYLRRASYEADATSQRLGAAVGTEVTVSPVIVLMGQINLTIKEPPADVAIVTRRRTRLPIQPGRDRPARPPATTGRPPRSEPPR